MTTRTNLCVLPTQALKWLRLPYTCNYKLKLHAHCTCSQFIHQLYDVAHGKHKTREDVILLACEQSLLRSRICGEERKIFEGRVARASGKSASSPRATRGFAARTRHSPLDCRALPRGFRSKRDIIRSLLFNMYLL